MASIVDELMARKGAIDPDFLGVNQAKAGDTVWDRERGESEEQFLTRAQRDASLLGYKLIRIAGHIEVGSSHQFCRADCARLDLRSVS